MEPAGGAESAGHRQGCGPAVDSPQPHGLGHRLGDGLGIPTKEEAGNRDRLVHGAHGDHKGDPHDADAHGSFQSADEENQETAGQLWDKSK